VSKGGTYMGKTTICLNGRLIEGDLVVAAPSSDYSCLIGRVKGIYYVGTPEHDEMTGNPTDDILVDFNNDYGSQRLKEIEEKFRDLYEDDTKTLNDISIDEVVMGPSELLRIDTEKVGEKYYASLLDSEARTAEWCFNELLNFTNSRPKGTVYTVNIEVLEDDLILKEEVEFNSECSAYEYACERYAKLRETFKYSTEDGWEDMTDRSRGFFACSRKPNSPKKSFTVQVQTCRWIKADINKEDAND